MAKAKSVGLAVATLLGAAIALAPALNLSTREGLEAAALVDGAQIERAEYERALTALAKDKRNPLTQADRERILERLIEEELLIQRGLEIGLVDRDRAVRGAIVTAMIAHAVAPAEAEPVDEPRLRAWYAENQDFFRPQPSLRVAALTIPRADAAARAQVEAAIARGDPIESILKNSSKPPAVVVPNAWLPLAKLQSYVGGGVAKALADAPAGGWVGPRSVDNAAVFFVVLERRDQEPPGFDAARPQIEAAFRRQREDEAFRGYLDWLKSRARITRGGA